MDIGVRLTVTLMKRALPNNQGRRPFVRGRVEAADSEQKMDAFLSPHGLAVGPQLEVIRPDEPQRGVTSADGRRRLDFAAQVLEALAEGAA